MPAHARPDLVALSRSAVISADGTLRVGSRRERRLELAAQPPVLLGRARLFGPQPVD